jgi:hypothetical protein
MEVIELQHRYLIIGSIVAMLVKLELLLMFLTTGSTAVMQVTELLILFLIIGLFVTMLQK